MAQIRPVPTSYYYSGQGRLGIGDRDPVTGAFDNVTYVGNVTSLTTDIRKKIQNRSATSQINRVAVDTGASQSVAPTLLSIDTTAEVTVALTGSIATATDTLVLENFLIELLLQNVNG